MTKVWLVVFSLLAACGSKDTPADRARILGVARVPTVATAEVLVTDTSKAPPVLIVMDDSGVLHVSVANSWDALAKTDPLVGAFPTHRVHAAARLAEGRALNQATRTIYEGFKPGGLDVIDLESLEEPTVDDAPPPPEEEEKPDNGADESGGTGTLVTLEEGMGKTDDERAEGQYQFKKFKELDPAAEAKFAAEAAQQIVRSELRDAAGERAAYPKFRSNHLWSGIPTSHRVTTAEVIKDGTFEQPYCLLLAAPAAKATDVVDTIAVLHPQIAVAHEGKVRRLRLETVPVTDDATSPLRWLELRVGTTDLAFEAVPDVPIWLRGPFDQAAFAATLAETRERRDLSPLVRVDLLVEPEVDAQRLIDVLIALDQAGVVMIGLGRVPESGSDEAKLRGARRSHVLVGQPNSMGDLPRRDIRRSVKTRIPAIRACYDQALATNAGLQGTVVTQFFITPNGTVASAVGRGVSPALADCVAGVVKAIEFPKPAGGGGVQVNYPFTFYE